MRKYLIVNGDDFGASQGINRGILEAHLSGILTSTSLMVNAPYCEEAVSQSVGLASLSVGLHLTLTSEAGKPLYDLDDPAICRAELQKQFLRFQDLMERLPTHIDSHHHIHRDPRVLPFFLELAEQYHLPMREHSPVKYFPDFYAQWDGETHLEQVSVEHLMKIFDSEIGEGFTELGCHPGYIDPKFDSTYHIERETELQTLCDSHLRVKIEELGITLIGFQDLDSLVAETSDIAE